MEPRLTGIRQVFLDMDGTIYHGSDLFPTTLPFLHFLKSIGCGYKFLSNNSSYSTQDYQDRLKKMGIRAAADEFYLSTDYTIDYLHRNHPEYRRLFVLGMESIFPTFTAAGFTVTDQEPDAVIVAFDRSLTYEKLCRAAWFLHIGVPGFATHPDVFCPSNKPEWLVDCGALTACLETSTGKKLKVLGKPDPGLLREAAARAGVPVDQCLMIGDRLSTDIAVGVHAGCLTCRINCADSAHEVVPGIVPDFCFDDLGELRKIWEN